MQPYSLTLDGTHHTIICSKGLDVSFTESNLILFHMKEQKETSAKYDSYNIK